MWRSSERLSVRTSCTPAKYFLHINQSVYTVCSMRLAYFSLRILPKIFRQSTTRIDEYLAKMHSLGNDACILSVHTVVWLKYKIRKTAEICYASKLGLQVTISVSISRTCPHAKIRFNFILCDYLYTLKWLQKC